MARALIFVCKSTAAREFRCAEPPKQKNSFCVFVYVAADRLGESD